MANNALKKMMKTDLIQMIKNGLTNNENYYLFISRATSYEDNPDTAVVESDVFIPSIGDSARNVYDTLRNMLFIKRVQPDNIRIVIPRVNWNANTAYDAYTETKDMAGKTYYVMTSDYNVYKCMGSNGLSKKMPTGRSTDIITLSDGYKWKYIYSIPEDYLGFITREYIPVYIASPGETDRVEQRLVQTRSFPGSIDSVSIDSSLSPTFTKAFTNKRYVTSGYTNYLRTNLGITPNVAGSSYIAFDPAFENSTAGNSYWNDYSIHVESGYGVGQYMRILSFHKVGDSGNSYFYANVTPSLTRSLTSAGAATDSQIRILPYMVVDGDGQNATVIPTMSSQKKITGLRILNSGKNYTYAKPRVVSEAASLTSGSQISLLNASITTSLSTPEGHGSNAIKEFGASDVMVVMEVDGLEEETYLTNPTQRKLTVRNDYRQFGLIKNPYLYGGTTLAGSEDTIAFTMLIKKQPYKANLSYGADTFVRGNYILGAETRASAKITDSYRIPGSELHKVELTNIIGNFRFSDDSSLKTRVYFNSGFSGSFVTGDNVFQYGTLSGVTTTAEGKVLSFNMYERSILIDCTKGSFEEGVTFSFNLGNTLSGQNVIDVDEEYGEIIKQVSIGSTGGSTFLNFGADENFGRVASTSLDRKDIEDIGEYRMTTLMTITATSGSLSDAVLVGSAYDGTIKQTNSADLKTTTGRVVDFIVQNGVGITGTAMLTDVRGSFNTTDPIYFIPNGSTAETLLTASVYRLYNPQISIGSGEVLYIENVRPIERNIEQSEEFKIVVGF